MANDLIYYEPQSYFGRGRRVAGRHGHETAGGCFPFRGAPRARSESSFSEIHYEHTALPAAGVTSARRHHHFGKLCSTERSQAQRSISHPLMLCMDEALQERSARGAEHLDGRRQDPAAIGVTAGAPCQMIAHLAPFDNIIERQDDPTGGKVQWQPRPLTRKQQHQLTIETVPRKKLFDPPKRDVIKHEGDVSDPKRFNRRVGYDCRPCKQTFTWMECAESGHSPKIDPRSKSVTDVQAVHMSCKGEKRYNVCGTQDLKPAATSNYTKSDVPPSARHVYENNRRQLAPFERDDAKLWHDPMLESTGMWGCLNWTTRRPWEPPERAFGYEDSWSSSRRSSNSDGAAGRPRTPRLEPRTPRPRTPPRRNSDSSIGSVRPTDSASQSGFVRPPTQGRLQYKRSNSVPSLTSRESTAPGDSRAQSRSRASSISRNSDASVSRQQVRTPRRAVTVGDWK